MIRVSREACVSSSEITVDRSLSRTRPAKISAIRNGVGGGVETSDSKVHFWYRNEGKKCNGF